MRYFLLTAIITFFLTSCSDSSETDREIIKSIEETTVRSNHKLGSLTELLLQDLHEKTLDAMTRERAKEWFPAASQVALLTNDSYSYIEKLKAQEHLSSEQGNSLFQKIRKYENDILSAYPLIDSAYKGNTLYIKEDTPEKFYTKYLRKASAVSTHAFLCNLQNRIKIFENKVVAFCNEQTMPLTHDFPSYYRTVSQNSSVLKNGDTLEIMAGIGAFTKAAMPKISINNQLIPLNEAGYSSFQQKINNKPGNYSIPVRISYIDQEGRKQTVETKVEYTVAKECDQ